LARQERQENQGFLGLTLAIADACNELEMKCLIFRQQILRWQAIKTTINAVE